MFDSIPSPAYLSAQIVTEMGEAPACLGGPFSPSQYRLHREDQLASARLSALHREGAQAEAGIVHGGLIAVGSSTAW